MMKGSSRKRNSVLVTGAGGYIGRQLMEALAEDRRDLKAVVAADVREITPDERLKGIDYVTADIRSSELIDIFRRFYIDTVVHLATIVTPDRKSNREFEYSVDVLGTENVLNACLESQVKKLIIASSGGAYGYYPDNPEWLDENDALRGNPEFAYSYHKKMVEEMLARYRKMHPELKQLVLRPGTVLGATVNNQITALFQKPFVIGLMGAASPFVFIWDQDVVGCILKGIFSDATGIYNLAGDGVMTMKEIAGLMGKPFVPLPAGLVRTTLWMLRKLGFSRYGPEQVNFLRYRPVLSNRRLKEEYGYIPQKTTREVFEYYMFHTRQE
ncbi:MAG: SDR family oxidoreductase [Desulfobacteraceae bacterium]|nr:MAG: SDR family oxidoreductase [Desulfobacteraceae bacterium]